METISNIRRQMAELSYELTTVKYELTFRKMMRALQVKFDPDQPRDEIGRWTGAGNDPNGQTSTDISSARRGQSEAVCWAQYGFDMLKCDSVLRAPQRAACRAQAMERYAACRSGRPIPLLNF
jgi:hypothetical protein